MFLCVDPLHVVLCPHSHGRLDSPCQVLCLSCSHGRPDTPQPRLRPPTCSLRRHGHPSSPQRSLHPLTISLVATGIEVARFDACALPLLFVATGLWTARVKSCIRGYPPTIPLSPAEEWPLPPSTSSMRAADLDRTTTMIASEPRSRLSGLSGCP